jgi:hypothetical protein
MRNEDVVPVAGAPDRDLAPALENEAAAVKPLSPAARRALEEAAARRARQVSAGGAARLPEIDGRGGPEPVRYGDWEVKGLATDF